MKALTVWQPWALGIFRLGKDVENRPWATNYRGPMAIHAGRTWDPRARDIIREIYPGVKEEFFFEAGDLRGQVIGVVDVLDSVKAEATSSRWASGPYCWLLQRPRELRQKIDIPGKQGLWDLNDEGTVLAMLSDVENLQRRNRWPSNTR